MVKARLLKSGLPKSAAMIGVSQVLDEGVDHGRERRADDHGDGEVDDVAAQDELAELLEVPASEA